MSLKFTTSNGENLDLTKYRKKVKLPDGTRVYESPSLTIKRVLKRKNSSEYKKYLNKLDENKRRLHNLHLISNMNK